MAGILIALTCVWVVVVVAWPFGFWNSHDDYVYLSLAHALNLNAELHDHRRYTDGGLSGHPGIPFYIVSWLCLRALELIRPHSDPAAFVLARPDWFLAATRVGALALALGGVAATWRVLREIPAPLRAIAVLSPFATDPGSLTYGLTVLGNESFALPAYAMLFWIVRQMDGPRRRRRGVAAAAGLISGAAYLIKLLYLDVFAAAIVATAMAYRSAGVAVILGRLAIIGAAFAALSAAILYVVVGWQNSLSLLSFHLAIILHTQVYGAGAETVVSPQAMIQSGLTMLRLSPALYEAAASLVLIAVLLRRWRSLPARTQVWLAAAVAALIFACTSVLKHYEPHYVVAISALMPFVWVVVLAEPALRRFAVVAVLLGLPFSLDGAVMEYQGRAAYAQAIASDERIILSLPLAPSEARLWTYRVASKPFAEAFVLGYAGVPALSVPLEQTSLSDYSAMSRVSRPYRYVVLDRVYFPDAEAFRAALQPSFWPTRGFSIPFCPDDPVRQLQRTLVVEISGKC